MCTLLVLMHRLNDDTSLAVFLIKHSLRLSAGAAPAQQMAPTPVHTHRTAACEQVSQFQLSPANYACVEMRAELG